MKKILSAVNMVSKKVVAFSLCGIVVFGATQVNANAAYKDKTAEYYLKRYSWCGLHKYTCGVQGDYSTNSKKIKYSSVDPKHYAAITWGYKDASAKWTRKDKKSGRCKAVGTFYQGISTQWIDARIQTHDETAYASAYR